MKSHVLGLLSALVCLGGPALAQTTRVWPQVTTTSLPGEMASLTVYVEDWPAITSFQLTLIPAPGAHIESIEIPPAGVITSSSETSVTANLTAPATPTLGNLVLATVVFSVAPATTFTTVTAVLQTTGPGGGVRGQFDPLCLWQQANEYTSPAPKLEKWGAQLDAHRIDFSGGATTQGMNTLLANTGSVWTEGMTVSALLTSPDGLQYLRTTFLGSPPPLVLAPGTSGELQLTFDHSGVLHIAGGWTAQVRAWGAGTFSGTFRGSEGSKTLHYRVVS